MENFSLDLDCCSKLDLHIVISEHDALGGEWSGGFKISKGQNYLSFTTNNKRFYSTESRGSTVYQMPQDWCKIKAAMIENANSNNKYSDISFQLIIRKPVAFCKSSELTDEDIHIFKTFEYKMPKDKEIKKLKEQVTDLEAENLGYKELLKKRDVELARLKALMPNSKFKPTKRIILNQYDSVEILVDDFEMKHLEGKILLTGKK